MQWRRRIPGAIRFASGPPEALKGGFSPPKLGKKFGLEHAGEFVMNDFLARRILQLGFAAATMGSATAMGYICLRLLLHGIEQKIRPHV